MSLSRNFEAARKRKLERIARRLKEEEERRAKETGGVLFIRGTAKLCKPLNPFDLVPPQAPHPRLVPALFLHVRVFRVSVPA